MNQIEQICRNVNIDVYEDGSGSGDGSGNCGMFGNGSGDGSGNCGMFGHGRGSVISAGDDPESEYSRGLGCGACEIVKKLNKELKL